jgi:hypothetical protein
MRHPLSAPGGFPGGQRALQWRHDAETFHYTHGQITNVIFGYSAIITPDGSKIVAATQKTVDNAGRHGGRLAPGRAPGAGCGRY